MKKADLFFNVLRLPVDFLMLFLAGFVTYLSRTKILSALRPVYFQFNLTLIDYLYLVFFVSLAFIGMYAISGLYSMKARMGKAEEFFKVVVASSAGILSVIIFIFLRQELFNSRFLVIGAWFWAIVFVSVGRLLVRYFHKVSVSNFDFGIHRVLIIGNDKLATEINEEINRSPSAGYRVIKHMSEPNMGEIREIFSKNGIDEVILTNPHYSSEQVLDLVDFCHDYHIIFKFIPNLYQTLTQNFDLDIIAGIPLIELKRTALDGWGRVIKRVIDVFASILGLIVCSPFFIIFPILIKLDSKGPVFVKLKRVSRNRSFYLFKFRSMVKNAEELKPSLETLNERNDGPLFKMRNDPRVTRIGRFIRSHRIDEIPQFINILKGDISLVGPRPHQPDEIERYKKHHRKVLAIKAGATGLAQVSGSSDLPFDQEVAYDIFYIENWSFFLDLKIIVKTFFKIISDHSAV